MRLNNRKVLYLRLFVLYFCVKILIYKDKEGMILMEELEGSNKILNYKQKLENILKFSKHEKFDKTKEELKELLKIYLKKNKLTNEEYDELAIYIDKINFENMLDNNKKIRQNHEKEDNSAYIYQNEKSKGSNKFKERIKLNTDKASSLDPIIMYKGKIGEVPPKRESKNDLREK